MCVNVVSGGIAGAMAVKGMIRNLCTEAKARSGVLLQVLSLYPIAFPTSKDSMPLSHLELSVLSFTKESGCSQESLAFCSEDP